MTLPLSFVLSTREPGKHRDDDNLYLDIRADRPAGGNWVFLYSFAGKARSIGLGGRRAEDREMAREAAEQAREKARDYRAMLRRGPAPREVLASESRAEEQARAACTTFSEAVRDLIDDRAPAWRNAVHAAQWRTTLGVYAGPILGTLPCAEIDTEAVLRVLRPIWAAKPETASRVRGRIEAVLDYAKVRGWRTGENPARWRGHLALILPPKAKLRPVVHHAALDWRQAPAFWARLQHQPGMGAAALAFAVATAARSGEVRLASWGELDLDDAIWTVPAARMKGGRVHRVPLSEAALSVLERVKATREAGDLVFPGAREGRPLSDMSLTAALRRMRLGDYTAHGFRSTFRDWSSECTSHAHAVCEQALAHAISSGVERAYRRGDLFDKRRALMDDWAQFLTLRPRPVEITRGRALQAVG